MAQVMPPQGPQGPQGAPQQQQQGPGPGEQAIEMIQKGFETIGKLMSQAQGQVDPDDMKLFQMAVQATDNFVQSISGAAEGPEEDEKPMQSGPMAANANSGAKPAPNQG